MEIYQSEDFINKYVEKMKRSSLFEYRLDESRSKINRILQKDNLYIDDDAYLVLQSETKENETRICNFFVLPIHNLYFDDGEKIHVAGMAVELYSQLSDEKYKRIHINLSDEAIEKGNWLNNDFIDRDFFVYKSDLYRYLRIAIKLSSRILKKEAKKVYYDGEWLEDEDAVDHINDSQHEREIHSIRNSGIENESDFIEKELKDAIQFLEAQRLYINHIKLFPFSEKPSDEMNGYGWEDESYYYLIYKDTWSWIRAYFNRNRIKLQTKAKELDHYLIEAAVFESNEERNNLQRADQNIRGLDKRVFMISKARFNEFLSRE